MSSAQSLPVGPELRTAREARGMSRDDVAEQTLIAEGLIERIENDDYSDCGGDFFARGHLRSIATAVGVDPASAVDRFDQRHGSPEPASSWERAAAPAAHRAVDETARPRPGAEPGPSGPSLPSRSDVTAIDLTPVAASTAPASTAPASTAPASTAAAAPAPPHRTAPSWRLALLVALAIVLVGAAVFVFAALRTSGQQSRAPAPACAGCRHDVASASAPQAHHRQ